MNTVSPERSVKSTGRKTARPIHFIVVGRGKMSALMVRKCDQHNPPIRCTNVQELPFPEDISSNENTLVVHFGSGRLLEAALEFAASNEIPLIQGSSNITVNSETSATVIDAPNLSLPVLALFEALPKLGELLQKLGAKTTVIESHQSSKTSPPITAHKIAGFFGNAPESVISVRERPLQEHLHGVQPEHLDGHAHHYVRVNVCGTVIEINTKINGRDTYFEGLLVLADKIDQPGHDDLDWLATDAGQVVFGR